MTSAAELLSLLERDLIRKKEAPSGIFMREVGSPDGKRRADALYIQAVGGKGIDGYEVKVSRSDLQAELTDPTKVDSWKRYCRRWWLVVPNEELLSGFDIPDDWGIKTPPTAKNRVAYTVVRPAPVLDPVDIGPALGRIATVWAYRMRDQAQETALAKHRVAHANERCQQMEEKLHSHGLSERPDPPDHKAALALVEGLRRRGIYKAIPTEDSKLAELIDAIGDSLTGLSVRDRFAAAMKTKMAKINQALDAINKSWEVEAIRKELDGGSVW